MRILVILPRVPWPLEKGDKLRAYYQLKYLSKNNEIILFALDDGNTDIEAAKTNLTEFCNEIYFFKLKKTSVVWNIFRSIFSGIPFQAGYFYSTKAKKFLKDIVSKTKPDHIYCQLIRTAEYGKSFNIPKTIDYQDIFSHGYLRRSQRSHFPANILFKIESNRLKKYEEKVFDWFDNKTIISKSDRDFLTHPDKEKVVIIPNGIDNKYFSPIIREKKYDIIFNGNMSYPPNIFAAEMLASEILPIVHKTLPDTTLLLSGTTPSLKVKSLKNDKVHVSGWVDDIRENYAISKIFAAPMQIGTGLQNKLLEAMCMKLPCITSPLANSSLGAAPNTEILIGDSPEAYAKDIVYLLTETHEAEKLAENGYKYVINTFDWEKSTAVLENLIKNT